MKILKYLTKKNLQLNTKRTIVTGLGIMLSVALICAVSGMGTSFRETLIKAAINNTGYHHLSLYNIDNNDLDILKNNRDIENVEVVNDIGYGLLPESINENKPYIHLYSLNSDGFDNLKFNLIEGRYPKNSNEIVISKSIITNANVNYKIGDQITIDIGDRITSDGFIQGRNDTYIKDENPEQLINTNSYTFTIVGIIQRPNYTFEPYSEAGYTVLTTNLSSNKLNAYISLNYPKDYKTSISEILGIDDYKKIYNADQSQIKYDYNINDELLRWEAFAFSDDTVDTLLAIIAIVISIIVFTSIFCIKNAFAISITEKTKMYGMLSSIGATKKQIKKSVLMEGMFIGVIAIPLGIVCGILADYILIKIVNVLIGDFLISNLDGIVFKMSIIPIIVAVILGIITIYLSALSSAFKASKISPIEAIRNNDDIKIKSKKLKTPTFINKIFGIGGVIAYKNLKRSKKKYRTTVISIAVSVLTFIAMNSFINYLFGVEDLYYADLKYDLYISVTDEEDVKKILKLENIDDYSVYYNSMIENETGLLVINDMSKLTKKGLLLNRDCDIDSQTYEKNNCHDPENVSIPVLAMDDKSFKKYIESLGLQYNKVKEKGILINNYLSYEDDKQIMIDIYNYKNNDTIVGKYYEKDISIDLAAVTDKRPSGSEVSYYSGGYLFVNKEYFDSENQKPLYMTILSSDPEQLNIDIDKLYLDDVFVDNVSENVKQMKSIRLVFSIFLYGFITVISLIGITNIFNTIIANMELRQKEFAILKSIGMTKREFNKMINLETLFYSIKSLVYGIVLGSVLSLLIYKLFANSFDNGFVYPFKAVIISIIVVFILVFIIMHYSISKINKQNTIETIRKENI